MAMWLLILAAPATVILWRVIGVAGAIWRERARVTARCLQMDAAASSRAVLCERLPDGTTLLVMPGPAGPDQVPLAEVITPADVIPAVRKPAA
jgi:hypothetical protein